MEGIEDQSCLFIGIGSRGRAIGLKAYQNLRSKKTHINEETGRTGINSTVSRKSAPYPHAPHSSEMGEIFPEKTVQKARRHLP